MHTPFLRLNSVFFFSLAVLFAAGMGCAAQWLFTRPPSDARSLSCALDDMQIHRLCVSNTRQRALRRTIWMPR